MPFVVIVEHMPGKAELRESLRAEHRIHLESAGNALVGAGAVLDDKGEIIGGIVVLDVETKEEAEAYDAKDPYALHGIIQSRRILKWRLRWSFGEFVENGYTMY